MYTYDPAPFREWFERDFTYLAGFRRTVRRFGRRTAVVDPATGDRHTYADLAAQVDALAAGLLDAGVRPGDVVAYQLFNTADFARLYLATQAAGAVGAPVNFRLAAGEVAHVLDDSGPRVFVYDTELAGTARDALGIAVHRPELLVAAGGGEPLPGSVRIGELARPGEVPPEPARTTYDETTRLYTSGTTGMPKGVPLNSLVEVFSAHDVLMHFPLGPGDLTLNMTPWFHRGGLYAGGPNPAFYVGAGVVPLRAFDPDRVLDLVAEHGITYLVGAPTNLEMLSHAQAGRARDLSSLRGVVTMGAPLERDACLRYQELLTPRIFNGYGTTETFWNTFLRPDDLPGHAGTTGRACTDDDVRVVRIDDSGRADPDDPAARDGQEIGEVVVRSPKGGYAYTGGADPGKFAGGWVRLGDLATWDADEFVTVVGRKDDMLVSGGENVHPAQVEEALNQHPGIADSLVVGVPDARWGRRVVAYVVRADPGLTADDCDRHCRAHPMLADFKRPRGYRFVDELPRNATGKKIHYKAVAQAADDDAGGLFETVTTRPEGTPR
ncbi:AMP-dependent synthetase [Pseudonocardia sp. EC080610-09]|uniref:class I adenylate-forming enzyme family protein n=1 Tax=unclassified Pseudonocardia TaxID=2619320 RepID=UPI0006CB3AD4|nr:MULTISPECIES: AMP-binding protein [unclassified Pseudonocardia]ALE74199.1 AMP-dependent synthetase [Pseudonocardia sp. EC080625-04]ALL77616.1 AMP-dependent synthetase [Pseudonocardia sp. EC080610-09]ALL80532.1 AMP-dependent synthetase [Pseudonocardia sp. EC080619-01]